jgi:quercetin dioxygenase-like cupin family protein
MAGVGGMMKFIRLYTGDDGETHCEERDVAETPELPGPQNATRVSFNIAQPGRFSDWHPAPRRQYVITLSGEAEIGLKDGSTYRLKPGDVNLAEDTTGGGHTTRVVSDVPRITVQIPLAD